MSPCLIEATLRMSPPERLRQNDRMAALAVKLSEAFVARETAWKIRGSCLGSYHAGDRLCCGYERSASRQSSVGPTRGQPRHPHRRGTDAPRGAQLGHLLPA